MTNKILLLILGLLPASVLAVGYGEGKIQPTTRTSLKGFIQGVQNYLINIVGAAAILFIVWGGFLYITSRGNKAQADRAKKTLTYAIGGLILVILAGVILNIINTALPAIVN